METQTQHDLAISELQPIVRQSDAYATTIEAIEIHDDDELANAGDLYKDLNHYRKKLEEKRTSLVSPLNKVVKDINALFKAPRDKIDANLAALKKKMTGYARRKEQIEQQKRLAEQKEAEEREKRLKEAAAKTREQTPGPENEVAVVLEEQAEAAAAEAAAAPEKRTGPVRGMKASVSTTKTWKGKVVDPRAVCAAIGAGRLPPDLVTISQSGVDALARALEKESTRDGIEFYLDVGSTVR